MKSVRRIVEILVFQGFHTERTSQDAQILSWHAQANDEEGLQGQEGPFRLVGDVCTHHNTDEIDNTCLQVVQYRACYKLTKTNRETTTTTTILPQISYTINGNPAQWVSEDTFPFGNQQCHIVWDLVDTCQNNKNNKATTIPSIQPLQYSWHWQDKPECATTTATWEPTVPANAKRGLRRRAAF